jgi:hypothetical protein
VNLKMILIAIQCFNDDSETSKGRGLLVMTNPNGTEANAADRSVRTCGARESKRKRELEFGWARDAPDGLAGRKRVREWKALM